MGLCSLHIGCGSTACNGLRHDLYGNGCSKHRQCRYIVNCGDGSNITGTYSADKLTLTSACTVVHFQFGSSHTVELFSNNADGLMGLGDGSSSLVADNDEGLLVLSLTDDELLLCLPDARHVVRLLFEVRGHAHTSSCSYRATPWSGSASACPRRRSAQ
jgi:hypothetical protein